ncbi:MAG: alpha-methylacyl-CoA racemase [Sphingomonadales bacterium]|jgi:alpha-methylacyl-CoA racemase|nr:alpha-methylacyl-CoA racemase [Sphingomonadales bacterium]
MPGPLAGVRILEMAGLGPAPFCGMMLADHGAEVIRVEREGAWKLPGDPMSRSRRTIQVDLKRAEGIAVVRDLARSCDGLIEGYRPGVMERLGLGPEVLIGDSPHLVYGRMTGWGQDGPLAAAAGHDINYIALSGALHTVGRDGRPSPPVNYLGDFGGGGMLLAFAMASALLAVKGGAPGQVIDCAMTEGSALLTALIHGLKAAGQWQDRAGANLIDGGSAWYDTYETADGKWVAVGALEPQFRAELLEKLGLSGDDPDRRATLTATFRQHPREHWCALLEGSDACFAPVLSLSEAPQHPHNAFRGTFANIGAVTQPAPAPRYSATPNAAPQAARPDADALLAELGYDPARVAALREAGIIG